MEDDSFMGFRNPVSRLEKPLTLKDVMNTADFSIRTPKDFEGEEEETDILLTYGYDKLEPYILLDQLETTHDVYAENPSQWFPLYRRRMSPLPNEDRIMKLIEKPGGGEIIGDIPKGVAYVHFVGYTEFMEIPFDVSRLRQKKPEVIKLGEGAALLSLELCIRSMKKGEESKFLVDPAIAFKKMGSSPRIPGNATILYDMELIDYCEKAILLDENKSDDEENAELKKTVDEKIVIVKKLRNAANKLKTHEKNINGAIEYYRKGLYILLQSHLKNEEEEMKAKEEMVILYANLAICYMNKKLYKKVCSMYNEAVHDCEPLVHQNSKLLYNSAKALRFLGNYKEAGIRLKEARALRPDSKDIIEELRLLEETKTKAEKEEKETWRRAFGFKKAKEYASDGDEDAEDLSNQLSEDFVTNFREQMYLFKENPNKEQMQLRFGATFSEQEFCSRECKKNHLSFRVIESNSIPTFIISKKLPK